MNEEEIKNSCDCQSEETCNCGENCECKEKECNCDEGEKCSCGEDCHCHEHGHEHHHGHCHDKADEYLALAKQIQADFENFRRHALEDIKEAKVLGQSSVIEVFLPCLDTFKEAKKSITDENILAGVEMIENKIIDALTGLGVEKIASIGEVYNPHFHDVIAVMQDESKDNDIILDEYQSGYTFKGKVIRHSKVIVNKC